MLMTPEDHAIELFAKIRRTSRWWSRRLGHHDLVFYEHLFLTLSPVCMNHPLDQLTTIALRYLPKWPEESGDGSGILSPGCIVPSASKVLDRAWTRSREFRRNTTPEDVWLALEETDSARFKQILSMIEQSDWS